MDDFARLGLKKEILSVLEQSKYRKPFEVQKQLIPIISKGKNVVFTSMTGSGKTLAYSLPFLGKINTKQATQMMIVGPTRELCIQISKELEKICTPLGIQVGVLYGGRTISGDAKTLNRKNHIMVGTPGRLIQHINSKTLKVGEVRYLVFDESDQMFDNGFYDDCSYLIRRVSGNVQIVLASATITPRVKEFMHSEIGSFEFITIGIMIPKGIAQEKLYCTISEKNDILLKFLQDESAKKILLFCNTKVKSKGIAKFLSDNNYKAISLSGDLEQNERIAHLSLFKKGKVRILVSTDVAARGIHIPDVDIVINYDVPTREEFYIHRIGRTGRNEKDGYAITFICPEDVDRYKLIEHGFDLDVKDRDDLLQEEDE